MSAPPVTGQGAEALRRSCLGLRLPRRTQGAAACGPLPAEERLVWVVFLPLFLSFLDRKDSTEQH